MDRVSLASRRVSRNQSLRTVKGHVTLKDIESGKNNARDKLGDIKIDEWTDRGVHSINGTGIVRLGKWILDMYDKYKLLMYRIHSMIAAVTIDGKGPTGKTTRSRKPA